MPNAHASKSCPQHGVGWELCLVRLFLCADCLALLLLRRLVEVAVLVFL